MVEILTDATNSIKRRCLTTAGNIFRSENISETIQTALEETVEMLFQGEDEEEIILKYPYPELLGEGKTVALKNAMNVTNPEYKTTALAQIQTGKEENEYYEDTVVKKTVTDLVKNIYQALGVESDLVNGFPEGDRRYISENVLVKPISASIGGVLTSTDIQRIISIQDDEEGLARYRKEINERLLLKTNGISMLVGTIAQGIYSSMIRANQRDKIFAREFEVPAWNVLVRQLFPWAEEHLETSIRDAVEAMTIFISDKCGQDENIRAQHIETTAGVPERVLTEVRFMPTPTQVRRITSLLGSNLANMDVVLDITQGNAQVLERSQLLERLSDLYAKQSGTIDTMLERDSILSFPRSKETISEDTFVDQMLTKFSSAELTNLVKSWKEIFYLRSDPNEPKKAFNTRAKNWTKYTVEKDKLGDSQLEERLRGFYHEADEVVESILSFDKGFDVQRKTSDVRPANLLNALLDIYTEEEVSLLFQYWDHLPFSQVAEASLNEPWLDFSLGMYLDDIRRTFFSIDHAMEVQEESVNGTFNWINTAIADAMYIHWTPEMHKEEEHKILVEKLANCKTLYNLRELSDTELRQVYDLMITEKKIGISMVENKFRVLDSSKPIDQSDIEKSRLSFIHEFAGLVGLFSRVVPELRYGHHEQDKWKESISTLAGSVDLRFVEVMLPLFTKDSVIQKPSSDEPEIVEITVPIGFSSSGDHDSAYLEKIANGGLI